MDELFVLVYFLIILNMFVILFMGYKECNNQNTNFNMVHKVQDYDIKGMETDNIFTRRS
jgi:hypothetical protein